MPIKKIVNKKNNSKKSFDISILQNYILDIDKTKKDTNAINGNIDPYQKIVITFYFVF